MTTSPTAQAVLDATEALRTGVNALSFAPPTHTIYNPLDYAAAPHTDYVTRYAAGPKRVLYLGMNPGPFGMAQVGVPFGEIGLVTDFLGIEGEVTQPAVVHPKRPIQGFACTRSEVSGRRLWGAIKDHYKTPDAFFADAFVANYCPLVFMEEGGRNRTPNKLPKAERSALFAVCDTHLAALMRALAPAFVLGIGKFAEDRAKAVQAAHADLSDIKIGRVLHPSPASPRANQGWLEQAKLDLQAAGVCG